MKKQPNKIGDSFGRLTIVEKYKPDIHGDSQWLCKCECGTVKVIRQRSLRNGTTKSCGCIAKEVTSARSVKHGFYGTPLYKIWSCMITRCTNENASNYKYYGGRGISVCDEWKTFICFYNDMSESYRAGLSLERINTNEGYTKNNCKWATMLEQANNKRNNRKYKQESISEAAKRLGMTSGGIASRIYRGWNIEDAFFEKRRKK